MENKSNFLCPDKITIDPLSLRRTHHISCTKLYTRGLWESFRTGVAPHRAHRYGARNDGFGFVKKKKDHSSLKLWINFEKRQTTIWCFFVFLRCDMIMSYNFNYRSERRKVFAPGDASRHSDFCCCKPLPLMLELHWCLLLDWALKLLDLCCWC